MERHDERQQREHKHFKKAIKRQSAHKKNRLRRFVEDEEDKNWKSKLSESILPDEER